MTREEACRAIAQMMMRFYGRADDLMATKLEAEALYDAIVKPAVEAENQRCIEIVLERCDNLSNGHASFIDIGHDEVREMLVELRARPTW